MQASQPLDFIIPGAPSFSLKNDRVIVRDRQGRPRLVPASKVTKYMNLVKASLRRQLESKYAPWTVLQCPIVAVLETHLFYKSDFPKSDIDNYYTTVQECLQDVVVLNDRQVESFLVVRNKTKSRQGQHSRLYIWKPEQEIYSEYQQFFKFLELKNDSLIGNSSGLVSAAINDTQEAATIDWF